MVEFMFNLKKNEMTPPMSLDTLGKRFKAKRISKGLTQIQLGEKANASQQVISKIEKDKLSHSASIHQLAKILDTTYGYLVDGGDEGTFFCDFRGNGEIYNEIQISLQISSILPNAKTINKTLTTTTYELNLESIISDEILTDQIHTCFTKSIQSSSTIYNPEQTVFWLNSLGDKKYLFANNFSSNKLIIVMYEDFSAIVDRIFDTLIYVNQACPRLLPLFNFSTNEFEYESLDCILSECNDTEIDEINTYMMKHGSNIDINDAIRTSFINNSEKIVNDLHGSIAVTVATQLTPNQSAALKKAIENWMHVHSRTFDPKNYL